MAGIGNGGCPGRDCYVLCFFGLLMNSHVVIHVFLVFYRMSKVVCRSECGLFLVIVDMAAVRGRPGVLSDHAQAVPLRFAPYSTNQRSLAKLSA